MQKPGVSKLLTDCPRHLRCPVSQLLRVVPLANRRPVLLFRDGVASRKSMMAIPPPVSCLQSYCWLLQCSAVDMFLSRNAFGSRFSFTKVISLLLLPGPLPLDFECCMPHPPCQTQPDLTNRERFPCENRIEQPASLCKYCTFYILTPNTST